jgi:methyl-accepting chemotaxis protein
MLPLFPVKGTYSLFPKEWNFGSFKKHLTATPWSRFRRNAQVRKIRTRLPALTENLERACKEVEPAFMGVGQELQDIYGNARGLTQQVLDSVNLIGGHDEGGVLFHLRGLAESSLVQLQGCQKDVSEKRTAIQSVVGRLTGLGNVTRELEKVGLLLKVVGVNIGVESARSVASNALFSVVAQDTGNLSDKIRLTIEDVEGVLTRALSEQQRLHADFSTGVNEIDRLGGNAHRIVEKTVQGIESLMHGMRQFVQKAGDSSRHIQQQVGDLVMAVQFHDSMSQRVAHISEALGDVARCLDEDASTNGGPDRQELLCRSLSILRVQSAQLRNIIKEIEGIHDSCIASFEEILAGFKGLAAHLSEIGSATNWDGKGAMSQDDPFKQLEVSFNDLNGVLDRGQTLMRGVRQSTARVSDTVNHISKCVREMHAIGFETHLMALNAIIKAAHLGQEGGAIEVLAREVKQSANQSRSVLEEADTLLAAIVALAEQLRRTDDDDTTSNASFDMAMEKIGQAYHRFTETTVIAHSRADEISDIIQQTKTRLAFMPQLAHRFSTSLQQIEALIEALSAFVAEASSPQMGSAQIAQRYTMEKERDIHEMSLYGDRLGAGRSDGARRRIDSADKGAGLMTAAAPPASAMGVDLFTDAPSATDESNDVELFTDAETPANDASWDNIELFETETVSGQAAGDEPVIGDFRESDTSWENVDIFDSGPEPKEGALEEEAASSTDEIKKEETSFGDNVELF